MRKKSKLNRKSPVASPVFSGAGDAVLSEDILIAGGSGMGLQDIDRTAVERAIAEFDDLGREAFLKKYGYRNARGYYLVKNNRRYDSKALIGVAHKYIGLGRNPLHWDEFHGGKREVADKLIALGYEVTSPADLARDAASFRIGQIYNRQDEIHGIYGGQERGGIATPENVPFVFLFTGESGEQYGYTDGWKTEGLFAYTGEGQVGDMQFIRGNRAIRDHRIDGRELLLFQATKKKGLHRFLGVFGCAGWEFSEAPDRNGDPRKTIIFHLVSDNNEATTTDEDRDEELIERSIDELRKIALDFANEGAASKSTSQRNYFKRSKAVAIYVLKRAAGLCESCLKPAPFIRKDGTPYLEPHHIKRIADGGPDHPSHVGAICPSCHREIHHGLNGKALNDKLLEMVSAKESVLN